MLRSEIIRGTLEDELKRTKFMTKSYEKDIKKYPKGTYVKRTISGKEYVYWSYRDGGKVITKYLGKGDEVDTEALNKSISERKRIERVLKRLNNERIDLERILK